MQIFKDERDTIAMDLQNENSAVTVVAGPAVNPVAAATAEMTFAPLTVTVDMTHFM